MRGIETTMNKLSKDKILTTISIILLLFTAMIKWNIYLWLTLGAIILILFAGYFKKQANS